MCIRDRVCFICGRWRRKITATTKQEKQPGSFRKYQCTNVGPQRVKYWLQNLDFFKLQLHIFHRPWLTCRPPTSSQCDTLFSMSMFIFYKVVNLSLIHICIMLSVKKVFTVLRSNLMVNLEDVPWQCLCSVHCLH